MTVNNTVPPAISGTPDVGQVVTTSNGTWTYSLDYLTYTYRWLRCDAAGANCTAIGGAINNQYTLQAADFGHGIRSEVTATEHAGSTPGGDLGLNLNNSPSTAWLSKASSLQPSWSREGVLSTTKLSWAAANNVEVIGLLFVGSKGVSASLATVNQWPQVTRWELDNEPYFAGVNSANWAQQALSLAQQIHSAHPSHEVICPVLVQTNGGDYFQNGAWTPWVTQILNAAPGLITEVDAWSGHPYSPGQSPSTPTQGGQTTLQVVTKVRNQLVARGASQPWHMTEFGWSVGTGGNPPNTQVSAANQASYLSSLVGSLRALGYITSMEYYCLQTWGTGYEQSFGLFNQDLSDRPSAVTFRTLV